MTDNYTARNNDAVDAVRSQDGRRSEVLKGAIFAPAERNVGGIPYHGPSTVDAIVKSAYMPAATSAERMTPAPKFLIVVIPREKALCSLFKSTQVKTPSPLQQSLLIDIKTDLTERISQWNTRHPTERAQLRRRQPQVDIRRVPR